MSIRKMTFSLASLIFLIAFGLVFVTTPVIANDETGDDHKDAAADGTTADPATGHTAPAGADGTPPQFEPGHRHPTAAIAVMTVADRDTNTDPAADPNMMVVDGVTYVKPGDGTNATQIPLRVTLSANIATGQEVASNELTITARRRDGTQVTTATIINGGGNGVLMANSMTVFDGLYLDIPADATGVIADDAATTVDESYLEVFVRVNTGAVLTPEIAATVDDQGAVVGPFVGVGNIMAATATKVIVVNEFPVQRPTVTIDVPDDATVDAAFTATLTFSEAVSALAATDIMVTGAVAGTPAMGTPADGTVWTVEITPTVGATSVEVGIMDAIAIGTAQTVTAATLPTVMIAVPDDATVDAAFTVTLTFSEAVSALAATDIMVTGGVAGTPAMDTTVTDGTVWTVEITPAINATSVEVGVMAATATGTAQTVTAATPPTVTIDVPDDATVDAAFTVTLTFSKAVSALAATDIMVTGGIAGTPAMDTTVTDGTVWTVEITPTVGATSVEVGVMAATATGTAQTVTATTPEEEEMLEAGDYLVIVRDGASPPFGNLNPDTMEWSDVSDEDEMPDLERLFDVGGTIQLKVEGATRLQVVFSEIMWAVDAGNVDDRDTYLGEQWIELHNRTSGDNAKDFAISDIKISTKEGRPALAEETDRVSNVVEGGKDWVLGKGQNGNSGAADGSGRVEFISMFRNNEGEPGHQDNRWTKSTELYATNHRGTPGTKERGGVPTIGTTNANRSPIIFNEISNNANAKYEWIELKNVSGDNVNLKNYEVTIVTSKGAPVDGVTQDDHNDADLIDFTDADRNVPAGGILLVVKSDPTGDADHPLAAGWNFGVRNTWTPAKPGEANWVRGVDENSARYMVAKTFNALPDNGEFVLVLRNRQDRNGSTNDNNIRDIAGYVPGDALKVDNDKLFTNLWPLKNFAKAERENNKLAAGTVQRRQFADIDGTKSKDKNQNDKTAFRDDDNGWSGIGYKRNAPQTAQNGGTPGHPFSSAARHHKHDETTRSSVIVSEVMPSTGPRNLPEWIELYNTSKTDAVSVEKWRITITNHDKDSKDGKDGSYAGDLSISFTIDGSIPPNQPYLIVSRLARDETKLPDDRVHSVGRRAGQLLLNPYGFQIKVEAWEKDSVYHPVETVGNLGAKQEGDRRSNAQSFEPVAWDLPATVDDDNNRVSIVRVSNMMTGPVDGMKIDGWIRFDMSKQSSQTLDGTSYGHSSDIGSPGHSVGGVLPVSLSKFRPERMKDTGQIVIRWITESELNNAGFNILRSEKRDGEFTQINTKLIAGQGTTTARTSYEYADTSAKPNVVYYYQIQDVSFDGKVTTLRTTHLRGNVTAVGKATTTWGNIKALQ